VKRDSTKNWVIEMLNPGDLLKKSYLEFRRMLLKEQGPFSLGAGSEPKEGEIRIFGIYPPIYLLITEQLKRLPEIFKVIPLSEEIKLCYLNKRTPIFVFKTLRMCLCALPLELYAERGLLYTYSKRIAKTQKPSLNKCQKYVINTIIPEATYQGRFIKLQEERLLKLGLTLHQDHLLKEEVIYLDDTVKMWIAEEYSYRLTSSSRWVVKGKDFYGIVELKPEYGVLTLYISENLKGREVDIRLKNIVLYQGKLQSTKLVFKNFPKLSDYSFLEEDLSVQIRKL